MQNVSGTCRGLRTAMLCSASIATLCLLSIAGISPALAQNESNTGNNNENATSTEIVVTGSRIVRRDYSASSPIITVNRDDLKKSQDIGLEQQLNKLPQFVPGQNEFTGASDVQASPTNSPGAATLNLRGLGPNRNLVLVDGRRAQPFNASLAIDINSIPAAAIDSVEVVTGGAAAVYGADAIAGVVNFKLRHDFEGIELDGQWGETGHSDGQQIQGSMLVGSNLADGRGNVMLGLNYAKRDPVYQADRAFYSAAYTDPLTAADTFLPIPQYGTATGPGAFTQNPPSAAALQCLFSGVGVGCPYTGIVPPGTVGTIGGAYGINSDGSVFITGVADTATPGSPRAIGYNGPLAPEFKIVSGTGNNGLEHNNTTAQLSLPLDRYSLFASGHYDINDNITGYVQGMFTETQTTSTGGFVPASIAWSAQIPYNSDPNAIDPATVGLYGAQGCAPTGCTFGQDHAVPSQLAYLLNSRTTPNGSWNLSMELPYLGPETIQNTTDTYQFLAGFKGSLPDVGFLTDWKYDAYAAHGRTGILTDYVSGFLNTAAYQTLIAQPFFGAGYSNANNFLGRNATCTSGLPVFTTFTPSQDCLDIIDGHMKANTSLVQNLAEIDLQGGLFDLPAGQLRAAIGGDYRLDDFQFNPDNTMRTSNILTSASGVFDVSPARGKISVSEVYGELLVPVLKDLPFVKAFDLELGGRGSSYNTGGDMVGTYKALGNWKVNDWVSFRGGYQLANRAPNVAELYQPPAAIVTPVPTYDPCSSITTASYGNNPANPNRAQVQALCTALSHGVVIDSNSVLLGTFASIALDVEQGNPNLTSESATTWTAGTVLRSPWQTPLLSRFQASIDWYNIKISNAITPLTSALLYEECLNAYGGNPTYDVNNASCQLLHRDGIFGFPAGATSPYGNIGAIRTTGIDFQIDWAADLADFAQNLPGSLSLNIVLNSLERYEVEEVAGGPFVDYAGTNGNGPSGSQYNYKLYTTIGYSVGPANVSVNWRHLPQIKNTVQGALPTDAYDLVGLSGSWSFGTSLTLRAGVDNLFDQDPPIVGRVPGTNNATGLTDAGVYDTLGRRFYIGFTAKL